MTNATLPLTVGQIYYVSVIATDAANNSSISLISDGITVAAAGTDITVPTWGVNAKVRDGLTGTDATSQTSLTSLSANWDAASDETTAAASLVYSYAIGTTAGGTNTVAWTNLTAGVKTVTKTGLTLSLNTTYYFTVKARDAANNWSAVKNSNGIVVLKAGTTSNLTNVKVGNNGQILSSTKQMTFTNITSKATLKIYTLSGKLVRTLTEGNGSISWDGKDEKGKDVSRGVYMYNLKDTSGNKRHGKIAVKR